MKTGAGRRFVLLGLGWLVCGQAGSAEQADSFVEFSEDFHSQCVMRNGRMRMVRSTHPARSIKIYLQRYYADRRQPGRTTQLLEPGQEAVPLGCTVVDGLTQEWTLVRAKFVD